MRFEDERVYEILKPLGFVKTDKLFVYVHEAIPFLKPFSAVTIHEYDLINRAIDYISISYFNLGKSFAYDEIENFIKKVNK